MRYAFAIILLAAISIAHSDTNSVTITGLHNRKEVGFTLAERNQIVAHALELVRKASYEADHTIATEERFNRIQYDSNLHIVFTAPQEVTVHASTTGPAVDMDLRIKEILIPISATNWPDYIFVREQKRLRAFAKYDPGSAQALRDILKDKW